MKPWFSTQDMASAHRPVQKSAIKMNKTKLREAVTGYAFLMPNFLGFLLFTSLPVVASLFLAFCEWDLIGSIQFVGFRNFKHLLGCHITDQTLAVARRKQLFRVIERDSHGKAYVKAVIETGTEYQPRYSAVSGWIEGEAVRPAAHVFEVKAAETPLFVDGKPGGALKKGMLVQLSNVVGDDRLGVHAYLYGVLKKGEVRKEDLQPMAGEAVVVTARVAAVTERRLVANDPDFWKYAWNTVFLMMGVPINLAISLMLALLLNQKLKGIVLFRTVYFLPSVTTGVALYMLWRWIYNPDFGILNALLAGIWPIYKGAVALLAHVLPGRVYPFVRDALLPEWPIEWLSSTFWAKPAIMLMNVWTFMGGPTMIIYLAGLQNIPPELYEAAEIDGANRWQKFWHVTWPMLSPTTFFLFVMGMIRGFQGGFEAAYIMTRGGPAGSTTTISYYIYNNAFVWFHMGYAAAIAWFLFVVVFIVTIINWNFGGKVVHYQ